MCWFWNPMRSEYHLVTGLYAHSCKCEVGGSCPKRDQHSPWFVWPIWRWQNTSLSSNTPKHCNSWHWKKEMMKEALDAPSIPPTLSILDVEMKGRQPLNRANKSHLCDWSRLCFAHPGWLCWVEQSSICSPKRVCGGVINISRNVGWHLLSCLLRTMPARMFLLQTVVASSDLSKSYLPADRKCCYFFHFPLSFHFDFW